MMEYEMAAQKSMNQLAKQQDKELRQFRKAMEEDPNFKVVFSQDLIQLRNRIRKLISVGQYAEAKALKEKEEKLEKVELSRAAIESEMDIDKDRQKLVGQHEKVLQAMLRRIERDRREQLKHRQADTQRLIQRNKNLIKDIYNRQGNEKRKTKQFLSWALSDIHVLDHYKTQNSSVNQSVKGLLNIRKEKQPLKDIRLANKLIAPRSHKMRKNMKHFNVLMNKRESVPSYKRGVYSNEKDGNLLVLNNSPKIRNRSFVASNSRIQKVTNGTLMNITRHKGGGGKTNKKVYHNRSYIEAPAKANKLDVLDYSSGYN